MSSKQPQLGSMIFNPQFTGDQLARIRAQTAILPRPRLVVTDQIPPPGSIVPRGTVVSVVLTDINHLTVDVLQPDVPDAFKGVKMAELSRVLEEHPELVRAEATGTKASSAEVVQQLNTIGTGVFSMPLKPAEAEQAMTVLKNVGQFTGGRRGKAGPRP